MLVISGIEFTTCFKNMPMQRTIPENITAAKAIVKIVIIIINGKFSIEVQKSEGF